MRKTRRAILIVAATAVIGWIDWRVMCPQALEPLCGTQPVSLWLRRFYRGGAPNFGAIEMARWTNVVHSNAIP